MSSTTWKPPKFDFVFKKKVAINFDCRVERLVPIHRASSIPLGTKNLLVRDLEVLKTCIMA